jgi:hypothetical protein
MLLNVIWGKDCSFTVVFRIRIDFGQLDPGGQKIPTKIEKIEKFHVLKWWMFSFEG